MIKIKRRYDFETELLCTHSCILADADDHNNKKRDLICHKDKTYKVAIGDYGVRFKIGNYYSDAFRISDMANYFIIKQENIVKADKVIINPIDNIPTNPVPTISINGRG